MCNISFRPTPPAWRDEVVDNFSFGGPDGGTGRGRGGGFGGGFTGRGRGMMSQGPNMGNRWNQMGGPGGSGTGGNLGGWGSDSGSYG